MASSPLGVIFVAPHFRGSRQDLEAGPEEGPGGHGEVARRREGVAGIELEGVGEARAKVRGARGRRRRGRGQIGGNLFGGLSQLSIHGITEILTTHQFISSNNQRRICRMDFD